MIIICASNHLFLSFSFFFLFYFYYLSMWGHFTFFANYTILFPCITFLLSLQTKLSLYKKGELIPQRHTALSRYKTLKGFIILVTWNKQHQCVSMHTDLPQDLLSNHHSVALPPSIVPSLSTVKRSQPQPDLILNVLTLENTAIRQGQLTHTRTHTVDH